MLTPSIDMKFPPLELLLGQIITIALSFFLPIKPLVHAVLFLWGADLILGVWKSVRAKRTLTSYRFRKSISKITTYLFCIISTYVMQNTFLPDWIPLVHIVSGYIAWCELVSIYENASDISGKPFIRDLLGLIRKNFENFFKPQ